MILFAVWSPLWATAQRSDVQLDEDRFFLEQIEPILKSHCLPCHSHASGEMAGGLTLDSRSGWSSGGDRGVAIIPKDPDKSLLIRAVRREDASLQMPPDAPLPQEQVESLTEWIRRGASDPRKTAPIPDRHIDPTDWWSWQPLERPSVPGEHGSLEPEHAIDAFVRRRLHVDRLPVAPPADRRTMIRRVFIDLHGLPPKPEDVEAFVTDPDPKAYEKLVDRLLDSPRYGERWARHWLDTIHFADSHGCEHDVLRPHAWRYRDYVINSFNRDTPWSRFIREQLAADVFFPEQSHLKAALGFVAAGPLELSRAGTAPVTFDYLDRDDMVHQTMSAFASVTANCARCHHHKFDPITQEDYYSLQAVFAGCGKGDIQFDANPEVARQRIHWQTLLAALDAHDPAVLGDPEYVVIARQWEDQVAKDTSFWVTLDPKTLTSSGGATLTRNKDHSILASGQRPDKDVYTIESALPLPMVAAIRLDVLADDSLPMKGPGRQDNGNLHLNEVEVYAVDAVSGQRTEQKIRHATADWDQSGWTIAHAIDRNPQSAWGIYPKVGQSHHAVFELEEPLTLKSGHVVVVLHQSHGGGHLIGRFQLHVTDANPDKAKLVPHAVAAVLQSPHDKRSEEQQHLVTEYALRLHAEQQLKELPPPSTVYAISNQYSHAKRLDHPQKPKTVHVLKRGNIDRPGNVASPGALSAISMLPGRFEIDDVDKESRRRAALADWLASPDNPLTWRSVVNRVWAYHFGKGICDTPNDLGRMGGTPSHPELLNWLAVWFRDEAGGSLKQLHRRILLSQTYQRQSSLTFRAGDAKDPHLVDGENRLLWRMNRRRLDAETIRDSLLQISNRIDLTMGGPGVEQFTKSEGIQATPKLNYDSFQWGSPQAARRSVYRVVWRGIADPFMESLDFPDLGLLAPTRGESVSPLQALTMLNNDFVLHHCQQVSELITNNHPTVDAQVTHACRRILLREPTEQEHLLLGRYTTDHGLAATCRVLFNSNEFLFVD